MKLPLRVLLLLVSGSLCAQSFFSEGNRLVGEKKYREAIPLLEKAVEAGEDIFWIYDNLVHCYMKLDETESALAWAREGYRLYPDEDIILNDYVWVLLVKGWEVYRSDYPEARDYFAEAYRLNPKSIAALNAWGCALRDSGVTAEKHEAADLFQKGMAVREDDQYLIRNGYAASTASYFAYLDSGNFRRAEERLADVYTYPRLYREHVHDPSVEGPDRFDIHTRTAFYFNRYNRDENPPPEGILPYMRRITEVYPDNYMLMQFHGAIVWRHRDPEEGYRLCSEAYDVYRAVTGEGEPPDITLGLPLRGRIIAAVGRDSRKGPTHAGLNRYAVDLCLVDEAGANISYRAPVYAPCAGTVLEAATHAGGREAYALIDYGGGITVYLTHLLPGSLTVQPGSTVAAGDPLGLLGLQELPHLHIQAGYEYPHEVTLPFVFDRYDTPDGGRVRNTVPAEEEVLYSPVEEE